MEETGGGGGGKKKRKIAPPLIGRKNCPSDEKLFKERKMQWLRKDKCDSFIFESIFIRFLPRSNSAWAQREKVGKNGFSINQSRLLFVLA